DPGKATPFDTPTIITARMRGARWPAYLPRIQQGLSKAATHAEMGTALGLTRQRIHQIVVKAELYPEARAGRMRRRQQRAITRWSTIADPRILQLRQDLEDIGLTFEPIQWSDRGFARSLAKIEGYLFCIHLADAIFHPNAGYGGYWRMARCSRQSTPWALYLLPTGQRIILAREDLQPARQRPHRRRGR